MKLRDFRRQRGQSIVIIAVALVVLLIFGAFAVDLSFAFFQRRSMQNAADAAALAGARALGEYQSDPGAPNMTNDDLYLVIQEYAARNQAKYVEAYYTNPGGGRAGPIVPGSGGTVPKGGPSGVEVIASTDFSTFFARVMGYTLLDAEASAAAAYGAATSAKYVSPLAVPREDVEVGELCVLWNKNQATGNADTGWLALTCRYPSHGSYCVPTNPDLLNWTTSGYGGFVRAPGQYSGDPSPTYWSNISALSPGDVVIVPVFNQVRHYTTYSKCAPAYVHQYGAYECWENEIYGEIIPTYTDDPSYEAFYYYDVESFAACEIHSVDGESATGEYVPFSVEGDWVNPNDDGVFVVKLTDNKGKPTSSAPTSTPVPPSDANLALSFTPPTNPGIGPYEFTLTVENTGTYGSATDVAIELSAIYGAEWADMVSPQVWDVGDLAPGEVRSTQVVLTTVENWSYPTPTGAAVGSVITIEAEVISESSRPTHNVGKTATADAVKSEDFVPEPTPTPDDSVPPTLETPEAAPTATPNPCADHVIELTCNNYDSENDETTFCYQVTSGRQPSISHWVLSLDECILPGDIVRTSEAHEWVDNDPHNHMRGIKFDNGYQDNESRTVTITLSGYHGASPRPFGIKGGQIICEGLVNGPGCEIPEECPTLEVEFDMPEPIDCRGGPHTMRIRVRNTAEYSFAGDVQIDISALVGAEYIDSIVPVMWNAGDIGPGQTVETQIQLHTNAAWGEAQQGAQIQLKAQVGHEECGGEGSVGRFGLGEMRRGQSCGGCEASDAELVLAFDTDYIIGCGDMHTMILRVTNVGQLSFAGDVEVDLSAIMGNGYVESIEPSTLVLGDLAPGQTVETQITLRTQANWGEAADGEEIRLRARVRHEQCGSDRTVGKYGDARVVRAQCGGQPTDTPEPTATTPGEPTPTSTPNMIGPHRIDYLGNSYDGANTTFVYQVTSGDAPAISHWVLDGCFGEGDVVGASEAWEYVYSDPNLQVAGVKFDQGYSDGESRTVTITLRGRYSEEGRLYEIGVKSGGDTHFGTVVGPGCYEEPLFESRINAGGEEEWTDPYGNVWLADDKGSGGALGSTTDPIAGTGLDAMLQKYRFGDFYYRWGGLENGQYDVRLWFVEPWWTASKKREFEVTLNGVRVLNKYDIFKEVGHDRVAMKAYSVTVSSGVLRINFASQRDNAILCGVWVRQQE